MFWQLLKKCLWFFAWNAYLGGEYDDNMFEIVWRAYLFWIPRENKTRGEEGGERRIQKGPGCRRWHTLIGVLLDTSGYHRARCKPKNTSCVCVCTQYIFHRYIVCICMCAQAHLCSCFLRTVAWTCERLESRSQAVTQQNTPWQQAAQARLVGSHHCCLPYAPWLTQPTICKLLLPASDFKRRSLRHNVTKPQAPAGLEWFSHLRSMHTHSYKSVHTWS